MLVTLSEYAELGFEYGGDDISTEKALKRAELLVDIITEGKCGGAEVLPHTVINYLKQAICAQAEQIIMFGDNTQAPNANCKIEDFAYLKNSDSLIKNISPITLAILKLNGLFYSGTAAV